MHMKTNEKRMMEIERLAQKWNRLASSHHDEYYGQIANIAFDGDYDCSEESNHITDFEKLSRVWKLVDGAGYEPAEFLEEVKRIIYM